VRPAAGGTVVSAAVFGEGPTVIGHRGMGSGVVHGHRQNTLGSFTAAVRAGLDWVEVDVRRTADDVLVVAHDATYPDGVPVAAESAREADRRGTLRLETLLHGLPPDVGIDFDVKSAMEDCLRPPERTTAGLLAPVAAEEVGRRPLVASSFDPAALQVLHQAAPRVPLGLLTWYGFPLEMAVAACAHLDVQVLALHVGSLWPYGGPAVLDLAEVERVLALLRRCGRELLVWCPDAELTQSLLTIGVDAVVVDEGPQVLAAVGLAGTSARRAPGA
jgi:glycerophosphoryl diester phosphodiesterase